MIMQRISNGRSSNVTIAMSEGNSVLLAVVTDEKELLQDHTSGRILGERAGEGSAQTYAL